MCVGRGSGGAECGVDEVADWWWWRVTTKATKEGMGSAQGSWTAKNVEQNGWEAGQRREEGWGEAGRGDDCGGM